jgi:hypothetical protein
MGTSLRGISRITGLADTTVVSIIRAASTKVLLVHNHPVKAVETEDAKKQKHCLPKEPEVGDGWIAITLADSNGLILAARVGKHTDKLLEELVVCTEGKTGKQWNSDGWGGYERVLPFEIEH